jgi:hypothetical protein
MSEFLKIGFNQSDFFKVLKTLKHGEKVQIVGYINIKGT